MALGGVAFVTKKCDRATYRFSERVEEGALGAKILSEIGEVASEIAVLAQSMPDVAWCPKGALVLIIPADSRISARARLEKTLRRERGNSRTSSSRVTPAALKV